VYNNSKGRKMNYKLAATLIGDELKYLTTVNEINRLASANFCFQSENFPNDSITSVRAQCIYNWIMSLAKQSMNNDSRNQQLLTFCRTITPQDQHDQIDKILKNCGISISTGNNQLFEVFTNRMLHTEIHIHSKKLFLQGNFFHAVFEACKVYNKIVRSKSLSTKDGYQLMMTVWDGKSGNLKITPCITETDLNVQDGIKFLSAGLMQAVRNPTAHEPAIDWPINKEDCLDLLSFLSFLFRQLDSAVHYTSN
jgi:uncharacterized protein (TIGR02391 family)